MSIGSIFGRGSLRHIRTAADLDVGVLLRYRRRASVWRGARSTQPAAAPQRRCVARWRAGAGTAALIRDQCTRRRTGGVVRRGFPQRNSAFPADVARPVDGDDEFKLKGALMRVQELMDARRRPSVWNRQVSTDLQSAIALMAQSGGHATLEAMVKKEERYVDRRLDRLGGSLLGLRPCCNALLSARRIRAGRRGDSEVGAIHEPALTTRRRFSS